MKLRVTIDTDKCDLSDMGSMERGTYDVSIDGVEHCWYGSCSPFVEFFDVEVLECKHDWFDRGRDYSGHFRSVPLASNTCSYCEQKKGEMPNGDWVIKKKNGRIKEVLPTHTYPEEKCKVCNP